MPRPVTIFTGQWADLTLDEMAGKAASFGYDGLELACWGDHVDVVKAAANEAGHAGGGGGRAYCQSRHDILNKHKLQCWAISNHLVGQAVCDGIDERHRAILPPHVWDDGEPEGVRFRAAEEMKLTGRAAAHLGVNVVNGFTGSSIWPKLYFFPPTSEQEVHAGFDDFAKRWGPILDVYKNVGVRFALEVHPTEIAYDIITAQLAIDALGGHRSFGFNFDPSHLVWQGVDPVRFIDRFADRIFHVHMKDVAVNLNGEGSIVGSHLPFGDHRRAWEFRSVGRGDVDFENIIRALNRIGYSGPLSVEWEDAAMNREHGARESLEHVRQLDFQSSSAGGGGGVVFDEAFRRQERH